MSAIRIIPTSDDAEFPYADAKRLLDSLPGVNRKETDIPAIIEAGVKAGWPKALVEEHRRLMRSGKCFDYAVDGGIRCTLWENNIFFSFSNRTHEEQCLPIIEMLANQLQCKLFRH
ncbi:MAG: hypothetical protein JXB30_06845 [Anaerolineae bacterium]|nr:hypothetical protein [Anaerolineae bacterium]